MNEARERLLERALEACGPALFSGPVPGGTVVCAVCGADGQRAINEADDPYSAQGAALN